MRGKAESVQILLYEDRITPAYAGKSHSNAEFAPFSRDHPRICGEKFPFLVLS